MNGAKFQVALMVVLVGAGSSVLFRQHQETVRLRFEIAEMRRQTQTLKELRAEHQRLAALQASADELANLRAAHAELGRLRGALEAIKVRAASKPPARDASPTLEAENELIPAKDWKNAGRATPAAAFETILWAAAGGDIDLLSQMLKLDPSARAKAVEILAGLPDDLRATYSTPERLIALLGAKDVAVDAMRVVDAKEFPQAKTTALIVQLEDAKGKQKTTSLAFRQDDEGWKLVVPPEIVEKYGQMLKGTQAPTG
jgi:hypothetical protein